jgi:ABC-type glycerol-3-phosphate transport system substrate-binding protein
MRAVLVSLLLLVGFSLSQAAGTTLKFWAGVGTGRDVEMHRQLSADFEKESGIHVEVTPLAWGNFETKYLTAMAAGIPPMSASQTWAGHSKMAASVDSSTSVDSTDPPNSKPKPPSLPKGKNTPIAMAR